MDRYREPEGRAGEVRVLNKRWNGNAYNIGLRHMRTLTSLILIVICLIGQSIVAIGQTPNYCGNSRRADIEKIRKKFPFNEFKVIRLVSFKKEKEEDERKIPKT